LIKCSILFKKIVHQDRALVDESEILDRFLENLYDWKSLKFLI